MDDANTGDTNIVEAVDPKAAFSVLADGSRIEILRALWKADGQEATFSELRAAVGMDDSGKFNYHLGKLTDQFVHKTAEGYELRSVGRNVVGSLLSGAYTMEARTDRTRGPVSALWGGPDVSLPRRAGAYRLRGLFARNEASSPAGNVRGVPDREIPRTRRSVLQNVAEPGPKRLLFDV